MPTATAPVARNSNAGGGREGFGAYFVADTVFTPTNASVQDGIARTDPTYLRTDEGWLYLAMVLDLFNREVLGWSIKPKMNPDIVVDALTMTWFRRKPAPTRAAAMADLFNCVEMFYNRSRRHATLGYQSPSRFLPTWITTQQQRKLAA